MFTLSLYMYKSYTVRVGYFTFIPIILTKVTSDSISSELILFVCAMFVRGRNDNIEVIV